VNRAATMRPRFVRPHGYPSSSDLDHDRRLEHRGRRLPDHSRQPDLAPASRPRAQALFA